jgi:signal transduction histidine kinase
VSAIKIYAWSVVTVTAALAAWTFVGFDVPLSITEILFWAFLLAVAELLPVTLGFETRITMGFPIMIAAAILYEPPLAMAIAGLGSFDTRELRRDLPLHRALFNRAQTMLAAGVASSLIHLGGDSLNLGLLAAAAVGDFAVNLGLVAGAVHFSQGISFDKAVRSIPPKPFAGFALSYLLLTGLGAATAVAYERVGEGGEWVVIAILVPLLFARMTIQGAKAQEELSEKIRLQQEALLEATETVFQERERERARIAEHIHDSSLQMLAAAAYGCSNTAALLDAGKTDRAKETLHSADEAIHTAIAALRESLVDLRRASVEEGGLITTVTKFVDQLSVLWAAKIEVEGEISHEPPIPVALAAFQILQEGVVNALKHSNGDQIVVRITEDESHMVHLVVEDEGPGFDPAKHVESDHVGMLLMKERAEGVGGEIQLHSAPGRGTRLEAILPAGVTAA